MSKRSERREADRVARKLAYQQLRRSQQQQPQPASSPAEAALPASEPDLLQKAQAFFERPVTGRADHTLILKSENIEDYKTLESTWFQAYKPKSEAEKHMVQELVNADWFQQRANRTLADAEARIMNEIDPPLDWTEQHHKTIARLQRYLTPNRAAETIKQERHQVFKETNKPEPSICELIDDMGAKKPNETA